MPFVNIKVTGGKEAPTAQQKAELIRGATELLSRVLGKNPQTTVVIIEEVPMDNWGIGGESITERRKKSSSTFTEKSKKYLFRFSPKTFPI